MNNLGRLLLVGVAVAALVSCSFVQIDGRSQISTTDAGEFLSPSVMVEFLPPDFGLCSGFFVDNNLVMTANHCVCGNLFVVIKTDKDQSLGMVLYGDQKRDIALVATAKAISGSSVALLDNSPISVMDKVVAVGHPFEGGLTVLSGTVSDVESNCYYDACETVYSGTDHIQITTGIVGGFSGGPLYNGHGRVIGMVVAGGKTYGFAIKTKHLQDVMKKWRASNGNSK